MTKGKRKKSKKMKPLHVIQDHAAGIDIGATEIYVALPDDGRCSETVRCFATFTEDLTDAAKWLKSCGIETIAMESTGVYWIPVFQILEAYGFEVSLVNARHVKNVPGRKTDVQDCQWLQYLHAVGLLRGSYRPAQEVCAIRSLLRHRDSMVKTASSDVLRMQKALTQMNLQIHHVISDITGVTGLAILDALLKGERNPQKLAALRDRRIKADEKTIVKALKGDCRPEHIFTLKQALQSYRNYQKMIRDCDVETQKYLQKFESRIDPDEKPMAPTSRRKPQRNEPAFDLRTHLYRILGTDLCEIDGINVLTSHVFLTEVGPDISKFPTVKHFCSWLGLSPNNKISGGKILSSKTRPGSNRAAQGLRLAARALWNSQSSLGHYFRRMRSRHGTPKAITATAHKLARIIYHLVKTGKQFDESVFSEQEERYQKRFEQNLTKQANRLGYQLVPLEST